MNVKGKIDNMTVDVDVVYIGDNNHNLHLTNGKVYNVIYSEITYEGNCYMIKNDRGIYNVYKKPYFITAFEWRERKINKVNR